MPNYQATEKIQQELHFLHNVSSRLANSSSRSNPGSRENSFERCLWVMPERLDPENGIMWRGIPTTSAMDPRTISPQAIKETKYLQCLQKINPGNLPLYFASIVFKMYQGTSDIGLFQMGPDFQVSPRSVGYSTRGEQPLFSFQHVEINQSLLPDNNVVPITSNSKVIIEDTGLKIERNFLMSGNGSILDNGVHETHINPGARRSRDEYGLSLLRKDNRFCAYAVMMLTNIVRLEMPRLQKMINP